MVTPEDHYFIRHRLDSKQLLDFIEKKHYFILHAPRQSGKTTAVLEWVKKLNAVGKYKAFYINVEAAQSARGNVEEGTRTILHRFKTGIIDYFGGKILRLLTSIKKLIKELFQEMLFMIFCNFGLKNHIKKNINT